MKLIVVDKSQEKRRAIPALGEAVMELRGSLSDLEQAIKNQDREKLAEYRAVLALAILDYEVSVAAAPFPSAVTSTWIQIGEASMRAARTTLRTADARLSNGLRLVELSPNVS